MIIRAEGERLRLVRQADHGMLSGFLAAAWGGDPWAAPSPRAGAVLGARLHDLAWTPFDEALPLKPDGVPFSFLEVTRATATALYSAGLDAVESLDPYAGLLASLHYSGFYHSHWGWVHWAPNSGLEGEERAAVDRFVAGELARQRRLRERHGWTGAGEDRRLRCNYHWLQLWDRISLDVCRYGFSGWETEYPEMPAAYGDGAPRIGLNLRLEPGGRCLLRPYPLVAEPFEAAIPCAWLPLELCRPGREGELRAAWPAAGTGLLAVRFERG